MSGSISCLLGDNPKEFEGSLEQTEVKVRRGGTEAPGGREEEPDVEAGRGRGRGGGGKSKPGASAAVSSSFQALPGGWVRAVLRLWLWLLGSWWRRDRRADGQVG